jgi:hypothetical protein
MADVPSSAACHRTSGKRLLDDALLLQDNPSLVLKDALSAAFTAARHSTSGARLLDDALLLPDALITASWQPRRRLCLSRELC